MRGSFTTAACAQVCLSAASSSASASCAVASAGRMRAEPSASRRCTVKRAEVVGVFVDVRTWTHEDL